jgi:hypothetical protein
MMSLRPAAIVADIITSPGNMTEARKTASLELRAVG